MKTFRLLPLFVAVGAALALPLQAQSLVELYQSARSFDASYQSTKSQFDATLAKADQAKSAILPTANLALGLSRSTQEVIPDLGASSDRSYGTQSATVKIGRAHV